MCPPGTYGDALNLTSAAQCTPCIGGHYCVNGEISGECSEGHFCKIGQSSPTPEVFPSPSESYDVSGYWDTLYGGQCPPVSPPSFMRIPYHNPPSR